MIPLSSPEQLFNKQPIYAGLPAKNANNPSKTVLIIYDLAADQLPIAAKEMLEKLITACKFDLDKVAFINVRAAGNTLSFGTLKSSYSAEIILIFGPVKLSRNI